MKTRPRRLKELLVEAVLNNALLKDLSAKPLTPAAGRSLTPATTHEDHPFTGSMRFVYLHVVLFGAWFLVNLGVVPGVPRFDASFVVLAMVASVEAIFLSTFVLISQNRMAAAADKRDDLDLHISLLTRKADRACHDHRGARGGTACGQLGCHRLGNNF